MTKWKTIEEYMGDCEDCRVMKSRMEYHLIQTKRWKQAIKDHYKYGHLPFEKLGGDV